MKKVTITELRMALREILEEIDRYQEEYLVMKYGHPIVHLKPVEKQKPRR